MGKLATFKWFTDNYTRGSWEGGVSDNIFNTSRANVSATSNKAINYNDLINPASYSYNNNTIGAVVNKCIEQTDITNLMRQTTFRVDITVISEISGNVGTVDIYFINTDFDSTAAAASDNYPIKLDVTINGTTTYNDVNISYASSSGGYHVIHESKSLSDVESISSITINKVSVFRPNTTAQYIVKPDIIFNYGSGLSVSVSGQAANFAGLGIEISNYRPGFGGGNGENIGGEVLTINSSWKSTDEAEDSGLSFEVCWGYVASKEDSTVYLIENPESGTAIYVEDESKEIGNHVGQYIAFFGETIDISVPLFLSYEVRGWGDRYSLS